ncbi:hypothetical protein [Photobacterium rosenbergii]|uniref:Uncharacterized protein n=1 Tax=Photobacterium rosenbergii TaxID=294936 RepID=A0ABU3ZKR0_9GAMM|nr:hypothetical protein [Photobacterium rosenbergii]MDV5170677.1 hypothetical protein [Photobacterium rosenbergii]
MSELEAKIAELNASLVAAYTKASEQAEEAVAISGANKENTEAAAKTDG